MHFPRFSCSLLLLASVAPVLPLHAELAMGPEAAQADAPPVVMESARPAWGVAMGLRFAKIPFAAEDSTVTDVFPLFYYEGEHFFLRGLEGGFRLSNSDRLQVNAIGRYRFFDIPREQQNQTRGDALDMGLQFVRPLSDSKRAELEFLSDADGYTHANLRLAAGYAHGRWSFSSQAELRFKSADFNSAYYGLGLADIGAGVDARARLRGRVQVYRQLHLLGSIEAGVLDRQARRSPFVDETWEWEWYMGFGLFDAPKIEEQKPALEAKSYWRVAQGWGSDATIGEILLGQNRADSADVRMTSLFYGHPLSDTLFGSPIEVFLTPGIVHHYSSSAQDAATEYVLAFKFYRTFELPWRVRVGFAEGVSYLDSSTYYENKDLVRRGYRSSRLLNFLDVSADVNLGDIMRRDGLNDFWLGYSIHHRSGIFETSSLFGRIKGGSNFNSIYVQWSH